MGKFEVQCEKRKKRFITEEATMRPLTTVQLTEPSGYRTFWASHKLRLHKQVRFRAPAAPSFKI